MSVTSILDVAVVIPCYESARYVAEAVASVQTQTLRAWELLVVDDGSTDDPRAAVAELSEHDDRIRFMTQANHGVAAARNAGARAVGPSRYILFLDADDVLDPQMLERLVDDLNSHPEAGMAHCRPRFIDDRGTPVSMAWTPRVRAHRWGVGVVPETEPWTPFVSVFCLAGIVPSLTLIRRDRFDASPGWDEGFGQHYEDTLLFLQLALKAPVRYVADALVAHRRHGGQSTAATAKFDRQERKLYERFRDLSWLTADEAALVLAAWRFRERRLVPQRAVRAASDSLRRGAPVTAARFLGGAVRIWAASFVKGPAQARI
jgi:glycosyltransferase involved in cell wall biosynthesis